MSNRIVSILTSLMILMGLVAVLPDSFFERPKSIHAPLPQRVVGQNVDRALREEPKVTFTLQGDQYVSDRPDWTCDPDNPRDCTYGPVCISVRTHRSEPCRIKA